MDNVLVMEQKIAWTSTSKNLCKEMLFGKFQDTRN